MSVRASDNLVEKLVRERVLTEAGKNWLVAAIDPFHDTELHCTGYPDTNIAPSVLQVVKQSYTLQNPVTIPPNLGNWDCNIFTLPITNTSGTLVVQNQASNIIFSSGSITSSIGPLNVVSVPSTSHADGTDIANGQCVGYGDLSLFSAGPSRLVASGFEVVNTTSVLNKQGTVTVYRQPQNNEDPPTYSITTGAGAPGILGCGTLKTLSNNPASVQEAMLLTGSKQWAAEEGAYCVNTFTSQDLPIQTDKVAGFIFEEPYGNVPSNGYVCSPMSVDVTTGVYYFQNGQNFTSTNTAGAYFSGLSNSTTLQVTFTALIERFPNSNQSSTTTLNDLVVLAKPSPEYDVAAQEMYSRCLADMPVGVMVKENGLGEWFRDTIHSITNVATPILSMIPHPLAQGLAVASSAANRMTNSDQNIRKKATKMNLTNRQNSRALQAPQLASGQLTKSAKRREKAKAKAQASAT